MNMQTIPLVFNRIPSADSAEVPKKYHLMNIVSNKSVSASSFVPPILMHREPISSAMASSANQEEELNNSLASSEESKKKSLSDFTLKPMNDEPEPEFGKGSTLGGSAAEHRRRKFKLWKGVQNPDRLNWVLQDSDALGHKFVGRREDSGKSAFVLLIPNGNTFDVVPAPKMYKFIPKIHYKTPTIEEAELEMAKGRRLESTLLKKVLPASKTDEDETGATKKKEKKPKKTGDDEDDEFEQVADVDEEEDARLEKLLERKKNKQLANNLLGKDSSITKDDMDTSDDESENNKNEFRDVNSDDDEDEELMQLTSSGKQLSKLLKKNEDEDENDNDDMSEDEFTIEENFSTNMYSKGKEKGPSAVGSLTEQGNRLSSKRPAEDSSINTNSAKRLREENSAPRPTITPTSTTSTTTTTTTTATTATATTPATTTPAASAAAKAKKTEEDSKFITEAMVIKALARKPILSKDLAKVFKKQLEYGDNKDRLRSIVGKICQLKVIDNEKYICLQPKYQPK